MRVSQKFSMVLSLLFVANCSDATLTSNSSSKSSLPHELQKTIAVNSSSAIHLVASVVKMIEETNSAEAAHPLLTQAHELLVSNAEEVADNLKSLNDEELSMADISIEDVEVQDILLSNGIDPAEALEYLRREIAPWPPSERRLVEFLLIETRRGMGALQVMLIGVETSNQDTLRFGWIGFERYIRSVSAYSLIWSLVEQ